MRRLACLLLGLALLAGCSGPAAPPASTTEPASTPEPASTTEPEPAPTPPARNPAPPEAATPPVAAAGPAGAELLPRPETPLLYHLSDRSQAQEFYLQDGERLIGTYNDTPYVTWFVTAEGVFRQDPKGPALLRFLPSTLQGDLAWKQQSGQAEVWFRLIQRQNCEGIDPARTCWELTMLNRQEQTRFQLATGVGIIWVDSLHMVERVQSFTKRMAHNPEPFSPPDKELMLRRGGRRPDGPLPQVSQVSLAEFEQVRRAMLRDGGALLEIDLNNDGKKERLEGHLGLWQTGQLTLYDGDGQEVRNPFYSFSPSRLDLVNLAGMDRPTLLYAVGDPDRWHRITPQWMREQTLHHAYGWHPKSASIWGGTVRAEDDHLVATGIPAELGGYAWTRWYRVESVVSTDNQHSRYQAQLVKESWVAGPHPTEPADLLTAAFIARWWELSDDLARYIPDQRVREALLATKLDRPPYIPSKAQIGKLSFKTRQGWPHPIPELAPGAPAADGSADFLVRVGQYEGYNYVAGRVTFARGADGRLVISHLEITQTGFVY